MRWKSSIFFNSIKFSITIIIKISHYLHLISIHLFIIVSISIEYFLYSSFL